MLPLPPRLQAQLNQQSQNFLFAGQTFRFDAIRQLIYFSTFLFAPGIGGVVPAGMFNLFSTKRGDVGQGFTSALTDRETNWERGGQVPDEMNVLVTAIGVDIRRPTFDPTAYAAGTVFGFAAGNVDRGVPVNPTDVAEIADKMLVAVTYVDDTASLGKLSDYPFPGGAVGFVEAGRQTPDLALAGLDGTLTGVNARPFLPLMRNACNPAAERRLAVPLILPAKSQFSMRLIVPQAFALRGAAAIPGPGGEGNDASGAFEVQIALQVIESFDRRG